MAVERIVQTTENGDDEVKFEVGLRPHDFVNYIGQERVKKNLKLAIAAAKKRG